MGLTEDNIHGIEITASNFNVNNLVREKRNKKGGDIKKGLENWEHKNSKLKIEGMFHLN